MEENNIKIWKNIFNCTKKNPTSTKINLYKPEFYKMNILTSTKNYIFIANDKTVLCYPINKNYNQKLINKHSIFCDETIHHIKCFKLRGEDVLMIVGESGMVEIHSVKNLGKKMIKLRNGNESTWSCSICNNYVAVGSNGRYITAWSVDSWKKFFIIGCTHNIPTIACSPCGKFIAAASIDSYLRIFSLNPEPKMISRLKPIVDRIEWGWSVIWVKREKFKIIDDILFWQSDERDFLVLSNARDFGEDQAFDENPGEPGNDNNVDNEEDLDFKMLENKTMVDEGEEDEVEEEEEVEKTNEIIYPNDFLVYTTKHHVFLLSPRLVVLDTLEYNPNTILHFLHPGLLGLRRISILEYVEELSLLLIASQASNRVLMVRIVKSRNEDKFKLKEVGCIEGSTHFPITGLSVAKICEIKDLVKYFVCVLHCDRTFVMYELSQKSKKFDIRKICI